MHVLALDVLTTLQNLSFFPNNMVQMIGKDHGILLASETAHEDSSDNS